MLKLINKILKQSMLLFVVFLTGAAILVLEVVAVRILSVYFGNTIYTVSSVISVILLALSAGYFAGGRLADKKATEVLFYYIILASGFAALVIYFLNLLVVPGISNSLSLRWGPLLVSFLLFFLPSFLLGTLSPIVVTIQNKRLKEGIGKTTGDVYFWSTLGSIVGSLGCGFLLIPLYGIDRIILDVAMLLIIISILGLFCIKTDRKSKIILILLFFSIPVTSTILISFQDNLNKEKYIFAKDGVYEKMVVFDGYYRYRPVRFLNQDFDRSSAEFMDSSELVYDYTKYFSIYKFLKPQISGALIIGGGAYSVPKVLLSDNPRIRVDVVDVEPELYNIVKKYFRLPDDKRLNTYIEDGRRFLKATNRKYDLIFQDAFSFSTPFQLSTSEFFQLSKDRLRPGGVFVMNVIGDLNREPPSFVFSEIRTLQSIYPNSYFFAVESVDLMSAQNIILVGVNSEKRIDFEQAQNVDDPFLRTIYAKLIDLSRYNLHIYSNFTDNYAPVEYYSSKILKDN